MVTLTPIQEHLNCLVSGCPFWGNIREGDVQTEKLKRSLLKKQN